ncbi:major facilitator superfamily domain-containing protein [Aspergillus parasiticus]|uniref:Major facilitator superfamily domain-containing protein n=1 Tax=Aspergillus parasiticus TaxID=5067 RepID=A0A5N6D4I8_ASPPA|nr:major facilitator superfamily domain-containing protein [Aspergillus parasiticus]
MAFCKNQEVELSFAESQHIELARNGNEAHGSHTDLAIQNDADFPDGGVNAWRTALGGFLAFIASIGFMSGGSVFQSYYITTALSSSSASDIAWIGSVQLWGCFFFGIWAGRLSDKYGPALPLGLGTVFMVFGIMMASISKKYYQFLLSQGFCVALGMGWIFTPALAVQSQWFLRRRGFVVGAVMSGQNVGGIIWPVLTNKLLIENGMSLGWTLRIIGFIQLGLMTAATLLVKPRFPRTSKIDGFPIRQYFTNKRTIAFTIALVIMDLGIYIPWFYITSFTMQYGASASLAFYNAAILNGGAFLGCYALGIVADSGLGFFNSLTVVTFASAVVAFAWIGARNVGGIIVWTVAYGILSGALQAIFSPCLSLLAPTPEVTGSWNGIAITIGSFAVLGTGPIAGKLLGDEDGTGYVPMQLFTGICLALAGVFYLATRVLVSRDRWI